MVDGRVEETAVPDDEAEVQTLLTTCERVPLFSTDDLEPHGDYQVQVSVERRPRDAWFVMPWAGASASGVAHFTYLPQTPERNGAVAGTATSHGERV